MTTFIIRRLFQGIIILFVVTILVFLMMHVLPGDPLRTILGPDYINYSQEELDVIRANRGLDKSVVAQYFDWIGNAFRGDLGETLTENESVATQIGDKLPITLTLAVLALMVSTTFGLLFGVIAAVRRNKWPDYVVSVGANLGITVPNFWLAIVLLYIFGMKLGWVSIIYGYDFDQPIKQLILPVLCMALFGIAAQTRQSRSSVLEVAQQDYIRTAWSKGLTERVVIRRHLVKNGFIPVVTTMGMQVSFMFGGAIFIEHVFNVNGIGGMLAAGIANKDFPAVQGAVLVMAVVVVLTNLIVDISYAWLDPRIRESYR